MAFDNDMFTFSRDRPSDALTLNILGSLKSPHQTQTSVPLSTLERQDAGLQTARNDMTVDREVPSRDVDCLTRYSRNVDVRCFQSLKNFREKFKTDYSCDGRYCPLIKERLEQHRQRCRGSVRSSLASDRLPRSSLASDRLPRSSLASERLPRSSLASDRLPRSPLASDRLPHSPLASERLPRSSLTSERLPRGSLSTDAALARDALLIDSSGPRTVTDRRAQGSLQISTRATSPISSHRPSAQSTLQLLNSSDNTTPENSDLMDETSLFENPSTSNDSQKRSNLSNRKENQLCKEVDEWLRDVPMFPHLDEAEKNQNALEIENLVKKIDELTTTVGDPEQEQNIRGEIDRCMKNMPIWFPGSKKDLDAYKQRLVDNLITRIMTIINKRQNKSNVSRHNSVSIATMYESKTSLNNYGVKDVIIEWLWSINLKTRKSNSIANNMNKIANFILHHITPLLEKPMSTEKQKIILKRTVINVLNDLPIHINCPRYRDIHLQRFADDLVDRLQFFQITVETHTKDAFVEVSPALLDEGCSIHDNTCDHNMFNNTLINQEVSKCFQDANLKCKQEIVKEIEIIIDELMDTPSGDGENEATNEIAQLMMIFLNVPEAKALYLAQRIIKRIKTIYGEGYTNPCIMSQTQDNLSHATKNMSVYTSEEDYYLLKHPFTSNKKTKDDNPNIKLNSQEIKYKEKVAALIKSWMNILPQNFRAPEERLYKETVIQDIAADITDQNKIVQLTPNAKNNRQKYLKYIVYKWVYMLNELDINEIMPQIDRLLQKINDIPAPVLTNPQNINSQIFSVNIANLKPLEGEPSDVTKITKGVEENNTAQKFIKHNNYDVDDSASQSAGNRQMKSDVELNTSHNISVEIFSNWDANEMKAFLSKQAIRELEYIKYISDWLNNIPVDAACNGLDNRQRVKLVTNLASKIRDIEEQRECDPNAMDYNSHLDNLISQFMNQIPIRERQANSESDKFMRDQLLNKINEQRQNMKDYMVINESMNNTTGINTENIGDFLEAFIKIHGQSIADNELKLEVWASRLIMEIKRIINESSNQRIVSKGECYRCMKNVPLPGDETLYLFSLENEYIKEISNWMKDLPLLPVTETEEGDRGRKIYELAEKITEMDKYKSKYPNDPQTDRKLNDYITQWISQLPLDNSKNVDKSIVAENLLKKIKNVKQKKNKSVEFSLHSKETGKLPHKVKKSKGSKTGELLIDAIEDWTENLPFQTENENTTKVIKENISVKLFQKIGELNMDPKVFNNDLLYKDRLLDEINTIFENLPRNCQLQGSKDNLKTDLINSIIETKNIIQEKTAGDAYKIKLENMIEVSIPDPIQADQVYDPGFEIYKHRLASIFIMENFDHSVDEVMIKYERNLKKEIDKYFEHAQNKNSVPLSQDEIYNELYRALFKVPIPNEVSIIEEVEELKTRCEVDAWFEDLPSKEAVGVIECLERDKILAALAKRIHEIEQTENKPDQKIKKEIIKWLKKLQLQPGNENNIEKFADKLQNALKNTTAQRKCLISSPKSKTKKDKGKGSQTAKQRSYSQSPDKSESSRSEKKAADIIYELVQSWCNNIPLCLDQDNAQIVKDGLATKIMIKISELNADPAIINIDSLYNKLLDDELEILLSNVQTCASFQKRKEINKHQLIEGIKSVKPLIREEIAHQKYKENLHKTIDRVLRKPQDLPADKEALFTELKDHILDEFVQCKYRHNDHEEKQKYKTIVEEDIRKVFTDAYENKDKENECLLKTNQLFCELSKVPDQNLDLRGEIEEIRMKNEVTEFFNKLSLNETSEQSKINKVKAFLAQRLNEIEMNGHNKENEEKMKNEVAKCLHKLNKEVSPRTIEEFISKLRNNEALRRLFNSQTTQNDICLENCYMMKSKARSGILKKFSKSSANCQCPKFNDKTDDYGVSSCSTKSLVNIESTVNPAESHTDHHQKCNQRAEEYVAERSRSCSQQIQTDRCEINRQILCPCRKLTIRRRRPYCMVPMMRFCDDFTDDYNNPAWCPMQLRRYR